MSVSLNIANSVKTLNPVPLDYWYGNYSTVTEAIATIPIGKRFDGLTVKILSDGEYWWLENDLSDTGLVPKINGTGNVDGMRNRFINITLLQLGVLGIEDVTDVLVKDYIDAQGYVQAADENLYFEIIDDKIPAPITPTGVQSVVAGTNITVDNTDPLNPIVSSIGGGGAVTADDVTETATRVFVTPEQKTAITHTNRSILDGITEAFTTSLKSTYDSAVSGFNSLIATGIRLITSTEITKLTNTSGTNTGDETTLTIQTKRPLKTINNQSLEGSGDIVVGGGTGAVVTTDTLATLQTQEVLFFEDFLNNPEINHNGNNSLLLTNTMSGQDGGINTQGCAYLYQPNLWIDELASQIRQSNPYYFGQGDVTFKSYVKIDQLATTIENAFLFQKSFYKQITWNSGRDISIFYDALGLWYGTASPNWQFTATSPTNVRTTVDSNIPVVAGQWLVLKIVVKTDMSVEYYVGNTLIYTRPTALQITDKAAPNITLIVRQYGGTPIRSAMVDYFQISNKFNIPRP